MGFNLQFPDDVTVYPKWLSKLILKVGTNVTKDGNGCLVWRGEVLPSGQPYVRTRTEYVPSSTLNIRNYIAGAQYSSITVGEDCDPLCVNPEHFTDIIASAKRAFTSYEAWYIRYVEFEQNDLYPNLDPLYPGQDAVIAEKYGVDLSTIQHIRRRMSYKHIKEDSFERVD